MDLKSLIKNMIQHYFIICTGTVICTLLFCLLFYPDAEFSIFYFAWVLLFSLLGDLPFLVFYSRKTLNSKQWLMRSIFHFILLEAVLLFAAFQFGIYDNILQGIVFFFLIFFVYVIVRLIEYQHDSKVASKMNERIRQRRLENKLKEDSTETSDIK